MDKMDAAFAITTKLLFGRQLGPLGKYAKWARGRAPGGKVVKSSVGEGSTYMPDYGFFRKIATGRVVSIENMEEARQRKMGRVPEGAGIAQLRGLLREFACFVPNYAKGRNIDVVNTVECIDCLNVRDSFDPFTTKNSAYLFSVIDSENLFGAYRVGYSKFVIHAYNCLKLQRCFEMDGCKSCADCYFCHNCENLQDCMFCFNTKAKRYAIGNLELGRERYMEAKARLLAQIADEIERVGGLSFDIYDVLAGSKK